MTKFVFGVIAGWIGKTIYDHAHYNYVDDESDA